MKKERSLDESCVRTPATRKLRKRCSRLLGWVSWYFQRGPPVGSARVIFGVWSATSTLKGSNTFTFTSKEEEWEVIYRFVIDGKESVLAIILHGYFLEIEVSCFSRSERRLSFVVLHQVRLEIGG